LIKKEKKKKKNIAFAFATSSFYSPSQLLEKRRERREIQKSRAAIHERRVKPRETASRKKQTESARSAQSNRKDDRDDDSFARTGFGVATTVATEATSAFFNISRRSNFSSDDFEDALTEIEEKDFREDDVVFFLPLKRVFAVDATFVVVVTANIVWFLKRGCVKV
jgi:hypothetical protein